MALAEKKLEIQIRDSLQRDGWFVENLVLLNGRGWPDLTCFKDGRTVGIEVKRPDGGGVVSKQQRQIHAKLARAGIRVIIAESLDEVYAQL